MSRAPDEPLDVLKLAAASAVVERGYRLADFTRLADRLASSEGEVRARMSFHCVDDMPTGELRVHAQAVLICQRCLGRVRRTLESTSRLAFVAREDAPAPADHEAIAGDPRRIDMAALIEDEVLLSLPMAAKHRAGERCVTLVSRSTGDEDRQAPSQDRRRPFAELQKLLKT